MPHHHIDIGTKWQGGALLHALMISLLITGLIGAGLMLNKYQRLFQIRVHQAEMARENVFSGFQWLLSQPEPRFVQATNHPIGSELDQFSLETEPWGLYAWARVEGRRGKAKAQGVALWGMRPTGTWQAALHLKDQLKVLRISGGVSINGDIYVPKGRTERGGLRSDNLTPPKIEGKVRPSKGSNPGLTFRKNPMPQELLKALDRSSQRERLTLSPGDSVSNDWTDPVVWLELSQGIIPAGAIVQGKVILFSKQALTIEAGAQIDQVICVAPSIQVQAGYQGSVQLFATDSIELASEVSLRYPSAVAVSGVDVNRPGYLKIQPNSEVEGMVINDPGLLRSVGAHTNFSYLSEEAIIRGYGIFSGTAEIHGTVEGSVMAERLESQLGGNVYVNHLFQATLDRPALGENFTGGILFAQGSPAHLITWLLPPQPLPLLESAAR